MNADPYLVFSEELRLLRERNAYRSLKDIQSREGPRVLYRGVPYLNLSSNDYLGFSSDPRLVREFYGALNQDGIIDEYGPGSSSSRLLTGGHSRHAALEEELGALFDTPAPRTAGQRREALVFASGYHANTGIIPAVAGRGDLVLSDRLNHASIVDGVRLSGAERRIYGHRDYDELESILARERDSVRTAVIVTESLFSMDGDTADLRRLAAIKKRHGTLLVVDEAHAFGVYGEHGLGLAERDGCAADIDIIIATFGKALGGLGAFALAPAVLREFLINRVRPFIFTTALPPVVVNWNLFALKKSVSSPDRRGRLLEVSAKLRQSLADSGCAVRGDSHIIPVIQGDNDAAMRAADKLQAAGFLAFPIRPPTVPAGSSRIRISLRADIGWDDIREIPEILGGDPPKSP